jgi:hypothetical protein
MGPAPDGDRPPRRLRRSGWTPDYTRVSGLDARNLTPLVALTPSASARFALEGAPAKPATLFGCCGAGNLGLRLNTLPPWSRLRTTPPGRRTLEQGGRLRPARGVAPPTPRPAPWGACLSARGAAPPALRRVAGATAPPGAGCWTQPPHPATRCRPFGPPRSRAAPEKRKARWPVRIVCGRLSSGYGYCWRA